MARTEHRRRGMGFKGWTVMIAVVMILLIAGMFAFRIFYPDTYKKLRGLGNTMIGSENNETKQTENNETKQPDTVEDETESAGVSRFWKWGFFLLIIIILGLVVLYFIARQQQPSGEWKLKRCRDWTERYLKDEKHIDIYMAGPEEVYFDKSKHKRCFFIYSTEQQRQNTNFDLIGDDCQVVVDMNMTDPPNDHVGPLFVSFRRWLDHIHDVNFGKIGESHSPERHYSDSITSLFGTDGISDDALQDELGREAARKAAASGPGGNSGK